MRKLVIVGLSLSALGSGVATQSWAQEANAPSEEINICLLFPEYCIPSDSGFAARAPATVNVCELDPDFCYRLGVEPSRARSFGLCELSPADCTLNDTEGLKMLLQDTLSRLE